MDTYALLDNSATYVVQLVSPPDGFTMSGLFGDTITWVDLGTNAANVAVGWTYIDNTFNAPPVVVSTSPVMSSIVTPLQFLALFEPAELAAIQTAAIANISNGLLTYLLQVVAAQFIDLTDPLTIAGVNALVTAGLLTSERAGVILTV